MQIPVTPAPFATKRGLCGDASLYHILRFCSAYALLVVTGFGITQYALHPQWQIFGLGLMFPGAGFLAHASFAHITGLLHILYALLGAGFFFGSLVLWFATGNMIAPVATYFALTLAATAMRHGIMDADIPWIVLLTLTGAAILGIATAFMRHIHYMRARKKLNTALAQDATTLLPAWVAATPDKMPVLSPDDLALQRFALDRALQPLGAFNGFEWLDQYQTAAVRYQISFLSYALSLTHARFTPAFRGYSAKAQKNLILKQADHRIWAYWEKENRWGNLDRNPDPGARENIMYTGFCALQMAMYQKATGDDFFEDKNNFMLRHPSGLSYRYALTDFLQSMLNETGTSRFYLVSCEPNWIYPVCNSIGMSALKSRLPDTWNAHAAAFRHALEQDFINAKGNFISCRSRRAGFAFPDIGGALAQSLPCFFFNLLFPDIALRHWLALRRKILKNGALQTAAFWPIDIGNYGFSRAAAYAAVALTAAEMGDTEIRARCLDALDNECPSAREADRFYRPKASVWAHGAELMARAGAKDAFKALMLSAPHSPHTPHISNVDYHAVSVAAAHYHDNTLTAVFYPRGESGYYKIDLAGLVPDATYTTTAGAVTADHNGQTSLSCHMNGHTIFTLRAEGEE